MVERFSGFLGFIIVSLSYRLAVEQLAASSTS